MPATTDDPRLTDRFAEAVAYAHDLHHDQIRKGTGGVPYVSHLFSTAALVLEDGGSEDEAIAALLHDALEDQADRTSFDDIAERFGRGVAETVLACSDHAPGKDEEWDVRKQRYLAEIADKSPSGLRVSNADKLHNARSIVRDLYEVGDALWDRFSQPRDKQLWYYRSLAVEFYEHNPGPLAKALVRTVQEMLTITGSPAVVDPADPGDELARVVEEWRGELEGSEEG